MPVFKGSDEGGKDEMKCESCGKVLADVKGWYDGVGKYLVCVNLRCVKFAVRRVKKVS